MFDLHSDLYQIAFMQNDPNAMQQEVNWAKGGPSEFRMVANQAQSSAFNGKMREARLLFRQAIAMTQHAGLNEMVAGYKSWLAQIEALLGNRQQAREAADEAVRLARSSDARAGATIALAFGREPQRVKILTAEMKKEFPKDTFVNFVWVPTALAALEIQEGNGSRAIELLEAATPYQPSSVSLVAMYTRGLAYLETKSGREATAQFQEILNHRGVAGLSPLYSLSYLGLARAQAIAGDAAEARKSYQSFLASWRDADPDTPIFVQAKQEYAKFAAANAR